MTMSRVYGNEHYCSGKKYNLSMVYILFESEHRAMEVSFEADNKILLYN